MISLFITISLCLTAFLIWYFTNHEYKIRKALEHKFPESWRKILYKNVGFYHTLNELEKNQFEQLVHRFLLEIPIVGIKTEVSQEINVLVAASASIPVFSFKNWSYNKLKQVLIVDKVVPLNQELKGKKKKQYATGLVHDFGTHHIMFLSKRALLQGFKDMDDRKNVGIHEFVHILDAMDGEIDGIPSTFLEEKYLKEWKILVKEITQKIKSHESRIDKYATTNPAEFFAVTSEYFFENPTLLQKEHPKLYMLLSKVYEQDLVHKYQLNFRDLLLPKSQGISRNASCPCGSGKKFKQCCMNNQISTNSML